MMTQVSTNWDLVGERRQNIFGSDIWEEGLKSRNGGLEGMGS